MPLQLIPDQHLFAVGDVKVMAPKPDSVEPPYHPIQFRLKEHIDIELIGSPGDENECELEVKVQNIEDFEQSNFP